MNYRPEMISTGKYAFELAEFLAARGHHVEVVTTAPHYPGWRSFSPYVSWKYYVERVNGVSIWRCPMYLHSAASGLVRAFIPFTFAISSFPILVWRAIRTRPDVMITVQPTLFAAPPVLLAALLGRSRTVMHVQDLEIDTAIAVGHVKGERRLFRAIFALERILMKRFDRVVTISRKMASLLGGKGVREGRIFVIRNWVDTDTIRPLDRPSQYREALGIAANAFVVQYSGQMGRKQALHLLSGAARLLVDDPRFVFVLAGDGPARAALEADAKTLRNMRLLGLQPTEQMGEFLGLADCHILPQEADVSDLVLPSKLGGMLASGKRILVTADRDTELFDFLGDAAVFTAPGDPQAIADALRQLIDAPDETKGEREELTRRLAKNHVLADFEQIIVSA